MSIHVVVYVRTSFLYGLNSISLYVYTTFCLSFIYRWTLGCFYLLAIVNNAAMNMSVQKLKPLKIISHIQSIADNQTDIHMLINQFTSTIKS